MQPDSQFREQLREEREMFPDHDTLNGQMHQLQKLAEQNGYDRAAAWIEQYFFQKP